ncbi:D-isomer specific 2-hydroxyacid dehydrogenase family protein [Salipiger sp. IMCC34102]|uniref:NAD(P)-dependent oxidoreductase n=1 Tax=Salipiger sp. IMCC34102 TaxID=2510647 RepID=UPI0013EC8D68|nr:NAD(P)-dependent oxidoreductase [Salipiger sp. IMCC34102]
MTNPTRPTRVLVLDHVGLTLDATGRPDPSQVRDYVDGLDGCRFVEGAIPGAEDAASEAAAHTIHFHYRPDISTPAELREATKGGVYDAVIAAATLVPEDVSFPAGGVRIGAGTGNMASASWGGAQGRGGTAPLMNTPGVNCVATAQMAWKALMHVAPDLPLASLSERVMAGRFDTGRDLASVPTRKLEGRRIAVIGYGNIGREMVRLALAFRMDVRVFARSHHAPRIRGDGASHAATIQEAARDADMLSVHLGLGPVDPARGIPANTGLIDAGVLEALAPGAILVNFDRGELVDCAALDAALASGQVGHAAIDADVFVDPETGAVSGPMAPYLDLVPRHRARLCLLPHAAADTDHPTRVAGARMAVDQIVRAIRTGEVTNPVGDLPDGYTATR